MLKIAIITISDRASQGEYKDLSGPAIEGILSESQLGDLDIRREIVPDERDGIINSLQEQADCNCIITTGGTGLSVRDITPEVTREFCDREVPGISEMLRLESLKETAFAVLSRGYCGLKKKCLVVNFPGSVKGASFCARVFVRILPHALAMIEGKKH
jgi:molybdopterin adenylyltransferase